MTLSTSTKTAATQIDYYSDNNNNSVAENNNVQSVVVHEKHMGPDIESSITNTNEEEDIAPDVDR